MTRILCYSNTSTPGLRQLSASVPLPWLSSSWEGAMETKCWNGASRARSLDTWVSALRRASASPSDLAQERNYSLLCEASEISGLVTQQSLSYLANTKPYYSAPSVMQGTECNWNWKTVSAFKELTKWSSYMQRTGFSEQMARLSQQLKTCKYHWQALSSHFTRVVT